MHELAPFSPAELAAIRLGLEEINERRLILLPPTSAIERLLALWGQTAAAPEPGESRWEARETALRLPRALAERLSAVAKWPEGALWPIAMTEGFTAASRDVAPSLRDGLLEAILHISLMPTQPMGETVKPLIGMLNGLWRYRLGNSRLVYRPDTEVKRVAVVTLIP